jgi:prepilin-type N-terminal cleavage/methylation domain-containing protein
MKTRNPKSGDRKPSASGQPTAEAGRNALAEGAVRRAAEGRIPGCGLRRAAFSLIEILIVVALMSVIILGLTAMFSQTQKTFRAGLTQTDVLASGRLAGEMLRRELEQITPAYQSSTNFEAPNFFAWMPFSAGVYNSPFVQPLPGNTATVQYRVHVIHDLFFVSRLNQDWVGIGYFVRTNNPFNGDLGLSPLGVGNLYRFETNATVLSGRTVTNMFAEFLQARANENLVINGKTV